MSYTKGQWKHGFSDGSGKAGGDFGGGYILAENDRVVVHGGLDDWNKPVGVITEDDAHLIAAAPDLLEACKAAEKRIELEPDDRWYAAKSQLRAAIAKAEGK